MSCVLFAEHYLQDGRKIVEITLNAERSLNALSQEMIELIHPKLNQVRDDDSVAAVILDSAGEKAFCAGGDVVKLYHSIKEGFDQRFVEDWFVAEYAMDYTIHKFPKPIICWGSGIVMGGGMGMMNGCSHRVVTETTRMAMPEVTIALYPDVAASWFFNRMHEGIGLFLGLTAAQMNASDALYLGLADRYISSHRKPDMLKALQCADWSSGDHVAVSRVLKQLEAESEMEMVKQSKVRDLYDVILKVTDYESVIEVEKAILATDLEDKWWQKAQSTLSHGSPLAAHIIFQQLKRSRQMSLKEVFEAEMLLTCRCCQEPELAEGIRALLVDKDRSPQWMNDDLADVDSDYVDSFFVPYWDVNPLSDALECVDRKA